MKRAKGQGSARKGCYGICGMSGGLARRHEGAPPVEGNLRQEPGVVRRSEICWWDVSCNSGLALTHDPINFDQQAQVSQGHTSYRKVRKIEISRSMVVEALGWWRPWAGGGLGLVKPAREPASSRPKPCASLKKLHESCPFAAPCWPS